MRRFITILLGSLLLAQMLQADPRPFTLYKLKGKESGPTLLVFGGIHGNEPGGYFAPAILATHYRIEKGALWVTPNLNFDSIIRYRRGIYGDMNRKFAGMKPNDPDRKTVKRIEALIRNPDVDLILNLHDGHGYYRPTWQNSIFNPKAWGQACIIDQKCVDKAKYGDMDALATRVAKRLNRNLYKNHHIFNIKNTRTRDRDPQMRLSLTYYAVTHGKPALAIETSKNITSVPLKVLYQLRAIEAFMDEMGIRYSRDFDLNLATIDKLLHTYGSIVINGNFLLPLEGIDPLVRNVPLLRRHNRITRADSPLAALKKNGKHFDVMIGPWKITTLYPQYFSRCETLEKVDLIVDGRKKSLKIPSRFSFHQSFTVQAPKGYRVNIIGFTRKGLHNENHIPIPADALQSRYAMDRANRLFRVEIYRHGRFCGMLIADHTKERP